MSGLPQVDTLSLGADFQGALDMVTAWETELDDLDRQNDQMLVMKPEAVTNLQALSSRIGAARDNEHDSVQPAADTILAKVSAIETLISDEEHGSAIGKIDVLAGMLDDYEPEAERAEQYKRYTDVMSVLDLGGSLMDMRSCIYPEIDELQAEIEVKDDERLSSEQNGEWRAATDAAYAAGGLLGSFRSEVLAITAAKETYEATAPGLIEETGGKFFPTVQDDTGTVARYETLIASIRGRMETAATDNRFLEALEIVGEFRSMIGEAKLAMRDIFQVPDGQIDGYVEKKIQMSPTALLAGLLTAIIQFEGFARDWVNKERDFQGYVRCTSYVFDLTAAWVGGIPVVGGVAAAALSTVKITADVVVTEVDNSMDDEDNWVAALIVAPLRAKIVEANRNWSADIGPWFKLNKPDAYKENGNLLHEVNGRDIAGVNAALQAAGVPTTVNTAHINASFYNSLESQFKDARD